MSDSTFSNNSLLLAVESTLTDVSTITKVFAATEAVITSAWSKVATYSLFVPTSGNYISADLQAIGNFGTSDFKISFWCNILRAGSSNSMPFVDTRDTGSSATGIVLYTNTSGKLEILSNSTVLATGTTTFTFNADHFIELERTGTTLKCFLGGTQEFSITNSTNFTDQSFAVGSFNDARGNANWGFAGYINVLQIKKGVGGNTTTYTPPTSISGYTRAAFTDTISESLAITNWRVTATKCKDGSFVDSTLTGEGGSSYSLLAFTLAPCNITAAPKIDSAWLASKSFLINTYICAVAPDSHPHIWQCSTAGTSGATEPTWNLSGTTSDSGVTWTYIAPLVNPITLGPKIPT